MFLSSAPHLRSTLVGGPNVEVQQEVAAGESGTFGTQLSPPRGIGVWVNITSGQMVVWDLLVRKTVKQKGFGDFVS